jgi:hypothetical protein
MMPSTLQENKVWWNDLMERLRTCPGLSRGKYYDTWLTIEEKDIIREIEQCNKEHEELKKCL